MKFLVDMNLSPKWCEVLRQAGWEAAHWSAIGAAGATDAEILARARRDKYVLLTHDLDFGAILAGSGAGKPSVVQLRAQDVTPIALGDIVLRLLRAHHADLDRGAIVTLDAERARVRILPIAE